MSFWNTVYLWSINQQIEIYDMQHWQSLLGLTNTAQRHPCIATSFILVALLISYWQLMLQNLVGLMLINMEVYILIYLLLCVIECRHWIFIDHSIEYGLMSSPCTFYCSTNSSKKMNGEQLQPACMVFLNQDFCKLGSTPVYTLSFWLEPL